MPSTVPGAESAPHPRANRQAYGTHVESGGRAGGRGGAPRRRDGLRGAREAGDRRAIVRFLLTTLSIHQIRRLCQPGTRRLASVNISAPWSRVLSETTSSIIRPYLHL